MPSTQSSRSSRQSSGGSKSGRSSRKNSFVPRPSLPLDPRPSKSDPEARQLRKSHEKQYGGFDWTDGVELLCIGAVALFSIDKALDQKGASSKGKGKR